MHWRVRGTFVSWAISSVGTQSCPPPPGRSAGRPDPNRPWYVRVLVSTNWFKTDFVCSCFLKDVQTTIVWIFMRETITPGVLLVSFFVGVLACPCPALLPPRAPTTNLKCCLFWFWFRNVYMLTFFCWNETPVDSKTRTHNAPVGSGLLTAGRRGWAGLGRAGRCWVDPAKRQPFFLLSSESTLNVSSKVRTVYFVLKTDGGTKPAVDHQFTTGSRPVHPRFISGWSAGRKALLVPGCRIMYRRLFVSVNNSMSTNVRESRIYTPRNVYKTRFSRTCLAWKGFTKTKKLRSTGQQPGRKSASRPGEKPVMNRLSTAGFVPPSVYIGFRLFVLLEGRSGDVSSMLWRVRGTLVP